MGDEGSGRSKILSTITMILSTRLLIHSWHNAYTIGTLWGAE
jgi:hypothetical protein